MDTGRLTSALRRDEGCVLNPYRCTAGKLTIGIGRNLDDVGISLFAATRTGVAHCPCSNMRLGGWAAGGKHPMASLPS